MVGYIGQPSHLHYDMFYFYIHVVPVTSCWCMLGITLLLRMLYVLSFHYTNMLMARYYSYYTVVTYDICVMTSVGR